MKCIILAEGRNDVAFLSEMLNRCNLSVDIFLKEDASNKPGKYGNQSNCIRSFIESRNPYDVLLKSEGGKDNLIRVVCTEVISLVRNVNKVVLLVDLDSADTTGLRSLAQQINDGIKTKHIGGGFETRHEILKESNCLVAVQFLIIQRGRIMEESFIVVGVMPNLECVARIQKHDDCEEKNKKIKDLSESDMIFNFLRAIILPSN